MCAVTTVRVKTLERVCEAKDIRRDCEVTWTVLLRCRFRGDSVVPSAARTVLSPCIVVKDAAIERGGVGYALLLLLLLLL
jgi:hypothetical protein